MSLPVPHALAPGASAGLAGTNPTARAARLAPAAGPQVPALQPWLVNLLPPPAAPGFCRSVRRGTSWSWRCLPLPVLRGFLLRFDDWEHDTPCSGSPNLWIVPRKRELGTEFSCDLQLLPWLSGLPPRTPAPLSTPVLSGASFTSTRSLICGYRGGGVRSSFLFMTGGGLEHMETEFGVISGLHPQRSWSQEMNRNNHGLSVLT